jgi:hypothetical protein
VVFAFGILWLAKVTLLLLLTVMLSQERSLKRRYSETRAVCVFLAFWCVVGGGGVGASFLFYSSLLYLV